MKKSVFILCLFTFLFQSGMQAQCTVAASGNNGLGTYVTNQYSYLNCHRYIRTALLNNSVSLTTGNFISSPTIHSDATSIASDDRFVIVCDKDDAEAICFTHLTGQPDHSALVLNPGIMTGSSGPFASTPGENSSVYRHGEASIGSGGGTLLNYFAVVPEIEGSSSINSGQTKEYCLDDLNFIESITWSESSPDLQIIGSNSEFCVDIKANCNSGGGVYYIRATIKIKETGEIRKIEKKITVVCPVTNPCHDNTLDGGPLYTFNYISPGNLHTIQMAIGWSWSLNSGSPDIFQVSNGGKTVKLQISRGCVALRAYNSQCGSRNFIFCPGGFFKDTPNSYLAENAPDNNVDNIELSEFEIYPNPVSTELQIRFKGNPSFQVSVFDLAGRMIQTYQNENQISVEHLENGTYLFEIRDLDSDQRILKRVVVSK